MILWVAELCAEALPAQCVYIATEDFQIKEIVEKAGFNVVMTSNKCTTGTDRIAEAATKMALDAIQILGGNGYVNEFPAGRLLRDAKLYEIGAGTSEIRRMLIGRELFMETR